MGARKEVSLGPRAFGGSNRHITRALLHKNWIIKKRHRLATLSELLNPLLCIVLFAAFKSMDLDLAVPAGWATTTPKAQTGPEYNLGSHWTLFSQTDLLGELLSTVLSDAGLASSNLSTLAASKTTDPLLLTNRTTPLSVLSLVSRIQVPRFFFSEITMQGLLLNMAMQSLVEATQLNELEQRDMLLCVARFLLLGFTSLDPASLYALPAACHGKIVPYKLAITPDTLYTRQYVTSILDAWHPRLPLIEPILGYSPVTAPSFADSRMVFENESVLEAYMASEAYGVDVDHPKIYAAIAFEEFPLVSADIGNVGGHDMAFSIRMNATSSKLGGSVVRTSGRALDRYVRSVKAQNTMIFATRGFLTLQTAVMRVLNCLPPWDPINERVADPDECQLEPSTLNDTSDDVDNRLLRQLEGDVVIGTLLRVLSGLTGAAETLLAEPNVQKRLGNYSADINAALKTLATPTLTIANMPEGTKHAMLRVLRQAPQTFDGADVFMSPTEAFHYARFFDKVRIGFPVLFLVSYLYGVSRVILALLVEKETRTREFLKVLGIDDRQIIATWLVTYVLLFCVASVLQTIGASLMLFTHSSLLLLFAFFFTFALSSFGFGFLVSTLFHRARAGSFVGMSVFFMMLFVSFSFSDNASETTRTLSCLLSPVALAQGVNTLAQLESIGVGLNGENAHDSIGNFRFLSALYMQLIDFLLYMAIGWYLEQVLPKEYGVSERWYFLFSPAYWSRRRDFPRKEPPRVAAELHLPVLDASHQRRVEETVPTELQQQERDGRAIVISKLRKVFSVPGGTKVAVHGLDLALYEGQITCLLGHNGAGKTTLMSMLTGMTPPTSGDARIRGVSILDGMDTIRQSLGYCPQFSVVYPELTVAEHLCFYARVCHAREDAASVDRMLHDVGLNDKRHVQAHALSGGMKRKLSLAIAFLGHHRVVFLDEPTSGMDPYSRRSTWELIQRHKAGRIVILTTHFMDEADVLGDRIAIMADGELQCVGSSLFLKQRYGVGYRLSLVVQATALSPRIWELVQHHVADARLATDIGTELTFQLPFEASSAFPALFEAIDAQQHALGITTYAISVTTLEEIFLKVAETARVQQSAVVDKKLQSIITVDDDKEVIERETHGRVVWFFIQLHALLLKRFQSAKRDRAMLFYSMVLPVLILLAGLSALRFSVLIQNDPRLELTTVTQYDLGAQTPLPIACAPSSRNSDWCDSMLSFFPDAVPSRIPIEPIVFNGTSSPTVFNLSYDNLAPADTSGYCVRFAQLAFERAYAKDSESMAPLPNQRPVLGQYGGLLLRATTAPHRVLSYTVMVNSSSTHGAPTYKALADQAIHNALLANRSTSFKRVRVASHPFPLSFKSRTIFGAFLSLPAVLFVLIAFTFIPAAMMPFLVKEKQHESNARHQQVLSGVSLLAYWLANLLFDLVLYLVPMTFAILLLQFYTISSSLSGSHADAPTCTACTRDVPAAVGLLFGLFGLAIAPWTYAMSHVMHDAGACLLYTVMLNFVFGLVLLIGSYSFDLLDATRAANHVLKFVWRCSPLFSLSNGLLRVILADMKALYGLNSSPTSAFSTDIAGYEILYLAVEGPVFFAITLVVDMVKTGELTCCGLEIRWRERLLRWRWREGNRELRAVRATDQPLVVDDQDVQAERDRVLHDHKTNSNDVVRIAELSKTYANGKRALSNLTFGLQRGDCFGFLGINGAGKTTTMKILTGDLAPTHGTATLNGFDICSERARARQSIGYCPQFDALLDLLTAREHLELYGRLKGFSGKNLERHVERLLAQFQLQAFERKLAMSLSGGNKRKLSVAIAMLGAPALLFLDEPSTGMDPFSRRFLWDIILRVSVQSRQSTVVLTTHAMDECEALCNYAGIMVGGRLQCVGTIPHLKTRFGNGVLLECKLSSPPTDIDTLVASLEARGLVHRNAESMRIEMNKTHVAAASTALGAPERAASMLGDDAPHAVDARAFAAAWLLEDRVAALTAFLQTHFGRSTLRERQVDFCRFELAPCAATDAPAFALARVFRLLEDARQELGIREYAIAQTSLEQIFNGFARQRDDRAS